MMDFLFYLTIALFILVCLFMILLILIQKGRGGGLASAFGGAGGNTAFGSKTGDVLTWATSVVFGVFLVLAVALNLFANARQTAGTTAANTTSSGTSGIPGPGPFNDPVTPDPILVPSAPSTLPAPVAPVATTPAVDAGQSPAPAVRAPVTTQPADSQAAPR